MCQWDLCQFVLLLKTTTKKTQHGNLLIRLSWLWCPEERQLAESEKPLWVQLNWGKDVREGRFLLKNENEKTRRVSVCVFDNINTFLIVLFFFSFKLVYIAYSLINFLVINLHFAQLQKTC